MYIVELLNSARTFIKNLDIKMKAKVFKTIDLLDEFGPFLHEPHSKKVKGIKYLYELRIQQGSNIVRIFYFHYRENIYIVTSGFMKKKEKLDKHEIDRAEKLMKQFIKDNTNE